MKKYGFYALLIGLTSAGTLMGCDDEDVAFVRNKLVCSPGLIQCNSGELQVCMGTQWDKTKCQSGECNEERNGCKLADGQICEPGVQSCSASGDAIVKCASDGKSEQKTDCKSGKVCSMSSGKVDCLAPDKALDCISGESKCSEDHTSTIKCTDSNKWGSPEACTDNKVCSDTSGKCVENAGGNGGNTETVCEEGAKQCSGEHTFQTCHDNAWGSDETCPTETPDCDSEFNECVANHSGSTTVECTPEAKECVGTDGFRVCDDNGNWGTTESCPIEEPTCKTINTQSTSITQCMLLGACVNGRKQCYGENGFQTCVGNDWGEVEDCPTEAPNCDPADGECKTSVAACENGARLCDGPNAFMECKDGAWSEAENCPTETPVCNSDNNAACEEEPFVCEDGARSCMSNSTYVSCYDNAWSTLQNCPEDKPICDVNSGDCVARTCTDNAKKCATGKSYQVCSNNAWGAAIDCPASLPLCEEGECKALVQTCEDGARECVGSSSYRTCTLGVWGLTQDCPKVKPNCVAGRCMPTLVIGCTDGETECVGSDSFRTCVDGEWMMSQCPKSKPYCNELTGMCVKAILMCIEGATQCKGDSQVQTCNALGRWITSDCPAETPVCVSSLKKCAECVPGSADKCVASGINSKVYQCNDEGTYELKKSCPKLSGCNDDKTDCGSGIELCLAGARRCKDGKPQKCASGGWVDDGTCGSDEICNSDLGGVCIKKQCTEGYQTCESNTITDCTNGLLVPQSESCGNDHCSVMLSLDGPSKASCGSLCLSNHCDSNFAAVIPCSSSVRPKLCITRCETASGKAQCATTAVCTEYEYKCDGQKLQRCHNNAWVDIVDCNANGLTCNATSGKCNIKTAIGIDDPIITPVEI